MASPVPSLASLWGPSGEKEIGPPPREEGPVRKSNPHIFHCVVPREKLREAFRNWWETKEASQITAQKVPFSEGIVFGSQEPPGCQTPMTHSAGNGAWRTFQSGLQTVVRIFQLVVHISFSSNIPCSWVHSQFCKEILSAWTTYLYIFSFCKSNFACPNGGYNP